MKCKELLRFPNKAIRATAIRKYMNKYGYQYAVCFSCGHASDELRKAGVPTLAIAPNGDLEAKRWFPQGEVANTFKGFFDATSGHLPMELMEIIGQEYRAYLGEIPEYNYIPSGSGETLVCLKMAYPGKRFCAVYNIDDATRYDEENPLNAIVAAIAEKIIFIKKTE